MKTIECDESRWPLVLIRYKATVDESEFPTLLAKQIASSKRALTEKVLQWLIYDASLGYHASPKVRHLQAQWMETNKELLRLTVGGVAMVFTSPLTRGVLTAIMWVTSMPYPHTVVATVPDAEAWCKVRLAQQSARAL